MPFYFAYGSNMLRSRLERRVGVVRDHGCSYIVGYRHGFLKRGADGSAKGAIVHDPAARTYGVLYELTEVQLEVLDTYEGGYGRIVVRLQQARAVTYEPHAEHLFEGLLPTPAYVRHYLEGMREHAFPREYIELIESQIPEGVPY